jgi:hypothetical protein
MSYSSSHTSKFWESEKLKLKIRILTKIKKEKKGLLSGLKSTARTKLKKMEFVRSNQQEKKIHIPPGPLHSLEGILVERAYFLRFLNPRVIPTHYLEL